MIDERLNEMSRQMAYEAEVIGVSQESRDDARAILELIEEESMRVNALHRGTKE